jgi:hypothetical protein
MRPACQTPSLIRVMETEGYMFGAVLQAKAEEGSGRRRAEDDAQQRPSKRPRSDRAEVPSLSLLSLSFLLLLERSCNPEV